VIKRLILGSPTWLNTLSISHTIKNKINLKNKRNILSSTFCLKTQTLNHKPQEEEEKEPLHDNKEN